MADFAYNKLKDLISKAGLDWSSGTPVVRAMLLDSTSTYVPAHTHSFVSDVTGNGGTELSTTNYTRKTAAGKAVLRDNSGGKVGLDCNDITWTALGPATGGPTIKAVVFYLQLGGDDTTPTDDPILAYLDSGGSRTVNGGDITLVIGADGVVKFT